MSKFSLDYQQLENTLLKKAYPLDEVKERIERVAFDVVRFKDGDESSNLWQIQEADDGSYIVAIYEENPVETTKTASLPWEVLVSTASKTLHFFYKGEAITKIAFSQLGIPSDEVGLAQRYLPRSLAENKNLVAALLSNLDHHSKAQLLAKYPELQ